MVGHIIQPVLSHILSGKICAFCFRQIQREQCVVHIIIRLYIVHVSPCTGNAILAQGQIQLFRALWDKVFQRISINTAQILFNAFTIHAHFQGLAQNHCRAAPSKGSGNALAVGFP